MSSYMFCKCSCVEKVFRVELNDSRKISEGLIPYQIQSSTARYNIVTHFVVFTAQIKQVGLNRWLGAYSN